MKRAELWWMTAALTSALGCAAGAQATALPETTAPAASAANAGSHTVVVR